MLLRNVVTSSQERWTKKLDQAQGKVIRPWFLPFMLSSEWKSLVQQTGKVKSAGLSLYINISAKGKQWSLDFTKSRCKQITSNLLIRNSKSY